VLASILSALTTRPADAERWADVVDRWQYEDPARAADPVAEAWAAFGRAILCRHGTGQMHADADEAARRFAELGAAEPGAALVQGIARLLTGDHEGADTSFEDAAGVAEVTGAADVLAVALAERALLAMARGEWDQAVALARQARAPLRQAGLEECYATPLVCAVQARAALHCGDALAVRQNLAMAQRLRPVLTYAVPHLAVQARIELIRVYLALADLAGARTLMREIEQLLRRRPSLGTLTDQAEALRAQLSRKRGTTAAGASSLTAAELRLLPLLTTHLTFPEIGEELFLSLPTIKTQASSIYRKLGASTRSQAVARARERGLLEN
jgi:LuxR family maltose regulon positive regulatory protein